MKTISAMVSIAAITTAACADGWEHRAAASSAGGAWSDWTVSTSASSSTGGSCGGCTIDGVSGRCRDGLSLDACGSNGDACVACEFGETCRFGLCLAAESICIKILVDAGAVGVDCAGDADCSTDSWCRSHCCDPVVATCFAVNRCAPKLEPGSHCSHSNGDHECVSGACNIDGDTCL